MTAGSGQRPYFTHEEYQARLAKVRAAMDKAGLDVLVAVDPSNMAWLTGYDGWSFYTHQCVLVTGDDDPVWFGRGMDAPGARRTVWMGDDCIHAYEDHYVQSPERHPMEVLAGLMAGRGRGTGRIGVEMDNYYYSAAAHASLTSHLPNARFGDATGLVNWQRAAKSAREISFMRKAGQIVSAMHRRIFEVIEPGMRKNDLVAEIWHTGIRGVDGAGGDYPAIVPMAPSGLDATAAHLTWDEQPLRSGEATFFEIAGCYRRYHCPLSRTIYLGRPPQKFIDAGAAVAEGTQAALELARPGNRAEQVAMAFYTTIAKHGFSKDSRTGYPIGLSYPPDWGERTFSLRAGDTTVLEENMTLHFMPALWFDDGGLETTQSIVITASGPELLASYPGEMLVKD